MLLGEMYKFVCNSTHLARLHSPLVITVLVCPESLPCASNSYHMFSLVDLLCNWGIRELVNGSTNIAAHQYFINRYLKETIRSLAATGICDCFTFLSDYHVSQVKRDYHISSCCHRTTRLQYFVQFSSAYECTDQSHIISTKPD